LVGEYTTKIIALRNPSFYSQQLFAQRAVYFFTGGLILDWAKTFLDKIRQYKIFSVLCVILYLAALYLLPYIGMFSSSLIIEQEEIVEKK
jgi:hypothetical protein